MTAELELVRFLALFGAGGFALFVAHQVADHWVQTERQAARKGLPGWPGRRACAAHVVTYLLTAVVFLAALAWAAPGLGLYSAPGLVAGLAVSGVTHYIADRRAPLGRMARAAGHAEFWALGRPRDGRDDNPSLGTGSYALDQSWHYGWLFVSTLLIAAV